MIAKAAHVFLGEATVTVAMQLEAEELRRLTARQDHGLAGVKLEAPTGKILLDPLPPARQYSRIIVE